jgi:hypothetical protein
MKRYKLNLDLTGIIVLIAVGVLLPVMLSTAVAIVALMISKDAGGIVTSMLRRCSRASWLMMRSRRHNAWPRFCARPSGLIS